MFRSVRAAAAFALVVTPAFADDGPLVDKSAYTFFNPVPDDQMRTFGTDRPTKSDWPTTVDAGHFQYEADAINWPYNHDGSARTTSSNLVLFAPTLKAGLTQTTDLEIALAPLNVQRSSVAGTHSSAVAFGDVFARVKYNFLGNDGGDYSLAVVPYVKAPTGTEGISNHHWEGGWYAPFVATLPQDWTLQITSELDVLENANLDGMHLNYQNLINLNHPIFADNLTGYIEFWSDVDNDGATPTKFTLDLAVSWLVRDNLQLDVGVNIGLNTSAEQIQPYLGMSQRF
jgi:hypothetical protein